MRSGSRVIRLLSIAVVLACSSSAHAYRTASELPGIDGAPVGWPAGEVAYRVDLAGLRGLNLSAVERAVADGLSAWGEPTCADVIFRQVGSGGVPVSGDGHSDVSFVRSEWTPAGFAEGAAGATDVLYVMQPDGRWEITEADVWFNAWDFEWSAGEASDGVLSIAQVASHEGGHMLGVLHPCELGEGDCSSAELMSSVMHPLYSGVGSLNADDIDAVCSLYPSTCSDCTTPCEPACDGEHTCRDGECVPRGTGGVGDACVSDDECRERVCDPGGICRRPCGDSCAGDCIEDACVVSGSAFGEPCAAGAECLSGLCVFANADGVCTRSCGDGCPTGTLCGDVEGRRVCVEPSGSGCSSSGARSMAGLLLGCVVLVWRKRWI